MGEFSAVVGTVVAVVELLLNLRRESESGRVVALEQVLADIQASCERALAENVPPDQTTTVTT